MISDLPFPIFSNQDTFTTIFKYDPFRDGYINDEFYTMDALNNSVFHEQLVMQQCGRHTVNCLIQQPLFEKKDFENEAKALQKETKSLIKSRFSFFNPHKSIFGLGNYDIQIMERLMLKIGFTFRWVNQSIDDLKMALFENNNDDIKKLYDNIEGIIVNVPIDTFVATNQQNTKTHFFPIKFLYGQWYNLDSRLPRGFQFIDEEHMINWLNKLREIFGKTKLVLITVHKI